MAGCSSNFGFARVVNLRKEALLRKLGNQDSSLNRLSFRGVLKEVAFPVFCDSKWDRSDVSIQKKGTFFIMSMSQPPDESQSAVTTIEFSEVGGDSVLSKDHKIWDSESDPNTDKNDDSGVEFHGSGGNGSFGSGGAGDRSGGGGGGDGDDDGNDKEGEEFGPILKYDEVMRETEARGATLPLDMLEAAKSVGIRKVLLHRYLDLQGSFWPLGFAVKSCSILRNRMLADPTFLFKIGSEIVIDSCCATFAEVQKRGKDFWAEFELYVADLLVGLVVNVALVGMLAPYARIGKPSISRGFFGRMQKGYASLPSSVFEAERPGCRFSVQQRLGTYFYKGIMYGAVGFACGIIGQGIANLIMTAKRSIKNSEEDIPVPPLVKSAALWGVFLAVSSNTRYQIINGLERLVEASPLAKQVPPVALAFTVGVRFANNVYGGMQFVDWARWSGVQ
ncbi:protein RETICULATA, chloroplastic [Gastrolobium bilobum]|uniref:protein RETICULATA, chloroplastic n=1 Tax=Gastrolobium bilobum TaxID=150636 RepID=UPI002AAF3853|nr:protein RETICULATA, chloroplastic [Gastrolobium bilobum]XP_061348748.1 protein RETICULATA, chloroplastic [Gastrolobium bilobum]